MVFTLNPFTIKGQYFQTRTFNNNAEANFYNARMRRDMTRDRYDDYQEQRSHRHDNDNQSHGNGYSRNTEYYSGSSLRGNSNNRALERELREVEERLEKDNDKLDRLEGRNGLRERPGKQKKLNNEIDDLEDRREELRHQLGYDGQSHSGNQPQPGYAATTQGNGGTDYARAAQSYAHELNLAMLTNDPAERTKHLDKAMAHALACRMTDGHIEFPQGTHVELRRADGSVQPYDFIQANHRSFGSAQEAVLFTSNYWASAGSGLGTAITSDQAITAMNIAMNREITKQTQEQNQAQPKQEPKQERKEEPKQDTPAENDADKSKAALQPETATKTAKSGQPENTKPVASADASLEVASGAEATLHSGAKNIGHLSQNQVSSLQQMLVAGGFGPVANTQKFPAGTDDMYGKRTETALNAAIASAQKAGIAVDVAKLDFRDPKNSELVKLTAHLNAQATARDMGHAKPAVEPEKETKPEEAVTKDKQEQTTNRTQSNTLATGAAQTSSTTAAFPEQYHALAAAIAEKTGVPGDDRTTIQRLEEFAASKGVGVTADGTLTRQEMTNMLNDYRVREAMGEQGTEAMRHLLHEENQAAISTAYKDLGKSQQPAVTAPRVIGESAARHNYLLEIAGMLSFTPTGKTVPEQDKQIIHEYEDTIRRTGLGGAQVKASMTLDDQMDTRELAVAASMLPDSAKKQALLAAEGISKDANGVYHDAKANGAEIAMPTVGAKPQTQGAGVAAK